MSSKYGKLALFLTSLMLPLTLLVGSLVAWQLKTANPDNVDITAGLAYLRQILGASFITFALVWLASLGSALLGLRRDTNREFSRLSLIILVAVTLISLCAALANKGASGTEEAYREKQSERFFRQAQEQSE